MRSSPALLLAEDDEDIRETTTLVLAGRGYDVHAVADGEQAWAMLATTPIDLAVLDVMMPRLDGLTLLKRIRRDPTIERLPVILLTARDLTHDQVGGLDAGADDYIVKPFDGDVLDARIRAVLRRGAPSVSPDGPIVVGDLSINVTAMTVHSAGVDVALSATEFRLLQALADHRGAVLSRQQLLERVWGSSEWRDERVVDVTMQRLRAKLQTQQIATVRGAGYKLAAQ